MCSALRHRCRGWFLVVGSLLAMLIAIGLTTPGTLGHSFIGFFLLMAPFSFQGLEEINKKVRDDCRAAGVPVNVADAPSLCDFIFPAVLRRNCLTISTSSTSVAGRARRMRATWALERARLPW